MTEKERFRVWDATDPSVGEIKKYLQQKCSQTPLPLLYIPEDFDYCVHNDWNVLAGKEATFIGVLLDEKTLLYLKTLTKDDLKDNFDINAWIKEQFTIFPSRAATEQDIIKIKENRSKLEETFEILDYHGINNLPRLCWDTLVWLKDGTFHATWRKIAIPCYLQNYGEFPILSTFTEDKITMAIIRQIFQSAGT